MSSLYVVAIIFTFTTAVSALILSLRGHTLNIFNEKDRNDIDVSSVTLLIAATAFVISFLITGLVSISLAAGISVFLVQSLYTSRAERKQSEAKIEAISSFSQSLSDSISGGKSVSSAIRVAAVNPPKQIHKEVKQLQVNLSTGDFEKSINIFVEDLNDPAGDLLGAHLLQANSYATANLGKTMRTISETLNEYIITSKKVATSRRQKEFEIKGLTVVLIIMIIGLFVTAPDLLEVYQRDITGELKLSIVFGCALAGWVIADRLTRSMTKTEFALRRETR